MSTEVKWAIHCAVPSYVGFIKVAAGGRRYLCTDGGLNCQVVSENFTKGDPVSERQLLKND